MNLWKRTISLQSSGLVVCGLLLFASVGHADVELRGGVSYGVSGTFKSEIDAVVQATPLYFDVNWEPKFGKSAGLVLGLEIQHQFISYEQDGAVYAGTNTLSGVTAGFTFIEFTESKLGVELHYFPQNSMTVTSETTATVNEKDYSHSVLTTFTGSGAYELSLTYITEMRKGQFNKHERLRYGLRIGYFSQPITSYKTTVATSNSDLAPESSTKGTVDYNFSVISVGFVVGFAF